MEQTFHYGHMSRTKEFDETEILDRAMDLFHTRGFAQTSFADLVEHLGVGRQSLYDTYGDKHTLYHAALRRYMERAGDLVERGLAQTGPVRGVLREVFELLIRGACDGEAAGCFMVNSMVELAPHDAETRALAQAYARRIEAAFSSRLSSAQRAGEIPRSKDPVLLGQFLFQTVLGIGVAARAFGERTRIQQATELALKALD